MKLGYYRDRSVRALALIPMLHYGKLTSMITLCLERLRRDFHVYVLSIG